MQVAIGVSRANDWGGRRHDSTTPPFTLKHTHAHTHIPIPPKMTAVASLLLWIPLATTVERFSGDREKGGKLSKTRKI